MPALLYPDVDAAAIDVVEALMHAAHRPRGRVFAAVEGDSAGLSARWAATA